MPPLGRSRSSAGSIHEGGHPTSQHEEVPVMPQEGRTRLSRRSRYEEDHPTTSQNEEVVQPIQTMVQPTPSPTGSSNSTRTRGFARGLQVGPGDGERLPVTIPDMFYAPVGPHATKFTGESGCRVRNDLPSLHYLRWTKIPEAERALIEASLKANFNLVGTPKAVKQTLNKTLGKRKRDFTCSLHEHWKKLVDEIGMVHARSKPPAKCDQGRWVKLIDHKWTDERWKRISAINKANCAKSKTNHACGSKSLPIRVHEMIEQSQNGEIALPPFFKETNYNEKTKKWASTNREGQYLEMLRIEENQAAEKLPPFTAEEMSRKVLLPRSGIVKGLGMRPSSSFRMTSTSASQGSSEEVVRLQKELEEQRLQMDVKLDQQHKGLERAVRTTAPRKC